MKKRKHSVIKSHATMPSRLDIESPSDEEKIAARSDSTNSHDADVNPGRRLSAATLQRNPLAGMTREQVLADVDAFVQERDLTPHQEDFRKGALLAQVMNIKNGFEEVDMLSEEEKAVLRHEETHRWSQPFMLYFLCTLCAGSAVVQGMDQTAVNGAQVSCPV